MPDAAKWSIPNEVGGVFNTINFIAHTYICRKVNANNTANSDKPTESNKTEVLT